MTDLDYAKEWLKISERDYASAKHLETMHPMPYEVICYLSQQSVEKSLKAILAFNNTAIAKTHDIKLLYNQCKNYTDKVFLDNNIADLITKFATTSRYPDEMYEFTHEDAKLALKYANQVLEQVKQAVGISEEVPETKEQQLET